MRQVRGVSFDACPVLKRFDAHARIEERAHRAPPAREPTLSATSTLRPSAAGPTIIDALRSAAAAAPSATAVLAHGEHHTYAGLWADTGRLAAELVRRGVRAGDGVGVAVERSYGCVVALLAVLRAGGAYVPLDPAHPRERLEAMAGRCGIRHLIGPLDSLPGIEAIGFADRFPAPDGGADALVGPAADDPAYVIHTSGSTGTPKGVVVPHAALHASVSSLVAVFGTTPEDRVLSFASLIWDTSGEEIYPVLRSGGTLVIDDRATAGSVKGLFTAVREHSVTIVDLPTTFWYEVVDFLQHTGEPLPPTLRLVVIGGEEVRADAVRAWCGLVPARVRLLNTYGQTETTLVTHASDVGGPFGAGLTDGERVPIGRPLPHVRQLVDPVSGELSIGGPALALGYRGLPEATAERFVPDPGRPRERLFRTGDLVEVRPDGQLAFLGRVDRQLKVRGFRIEPEEIERVLCAHPGVRAAAAHALLSGDGSRRLAVTVVEAARASPAARDLLAWLRTRLPAHLVPSVCRFTPRLPVLPNGKTDYAMLEDPTATAAGEIAALAAAILDQPCRPDDDFFEAGGDSLLAARLISRVYRRFDVELTYVDLFEHRTPRELAALVSTRAQRA